MRAGDQIVVSGRRGTVDDAHLLELRTTDNMPDLGNLCDMSDEARKILAEEFRRIAVITYDYGDTPVIFVALEDPGGTWWDLQGQVLKLKEATQ